MFKKIAFAALAGFLLFSVVSAEAGIRYGDFPGAGSLATNAAARTLIGDAPENEGCGPDDFSVVQRASCNQDRRS